MPLGERNRNTLLLFEVTGLISNAAVEDCGLLILKPVVDNLISSLDNLVDDGIFIQRKVPDKPEFESTNALPVIDDLKFEFCGF